MISPARSGSTLFAIAPMFRNEKASPTGTALDGASRIRQRRPRRKRSSTTARPARARIAQSTERSATARSSQRTLRKARTRQTTLMSMPSQKRRSAHQLGPERSGGEGAGEIGVLDMD